MMGGEEQVQRMPCLEIVSIVKLLSHLGVRRSSGEGLTVLRLPQIRSGQL